MPDYDDTVKQLRSSQPFNHLLLYEAATTISALLAQRAVLVREVEAWRKWEETRPDDEQGTPSDHRIHMPNRNKLDAARAATDAAFTEGLKK